MSVPLPTTTFLLVTPSAAALDAQRNLVPIGSVNRGPYAGHASLNASRPANRVEVRAGAVGAWTIYLDEQAWPVTPDDRLVDDGGAVFAVHAAERRPGVSGRLGHVVVDASQMKAQGA
jgi:hypothetical protein